MDRERRQTLLRVKLAALVRDRWGEGARLPAPFPGGAALRSTEAPHQGWVLVDEHPARALGGALAWGWRHGVADLNLIVEASAGDLARRAALFAPAPEVWQAEGRTLTAAAPQPVAPEIELPMETALFEEVIRDAGAEPVIEHGVLRGEVLGLEVARVEDGRLLVGVGKHDREAHAMAYPDRPAADGLAVTVKSVLEWRRPGAGTHPANQLGRERWLRAAVVARPELVGLDGMVLTPVASPVAREDLRQAAPAPALGDGVLVVCSVGIDTDLVPAAADAWVAHGRPERLLLVVPEGDDHAVTHAVAGLLAHPTEVVTVPANWQDALA